MSQVISRQELYTIVHQLIASDTIVVGPVLASRTNRCFFQTLQQSEALVFDPVILPTNSIKEFFFPKHEVICTYCHQGKDLVVADSEPFNKAQVIFGARPCDAASLPILDKVFHWDYQDRFYQSRRHCTTVVTLACKTADENCFCTSVGLSPDTTNGADAELFQIDDQTFEVRTYTDKGKALFATKTEMSDRVGTAAMAPPVRFDVKTVSAFLADHFDDPIFTKTSMRCVGCGACTYLCPTCHCFDIVDEGGGDHGCRVKNWDSCQMAMFTHHASGHNPRSDQSARQRNRIQHKFNIYPGKFGEVLCTGCGNCSRECSASLGVRAVMELLEQKAKKG